MLTKSQLQVMRDLVGLFNENGIPIQVSGGLAAIAYGATRNLHDIDIEIYKRDVEKARALLQPYIVEDWNRELDGHDDQFDLWMMTLSIDGVAVDISQLEDCRLRSPDGEWVSQPETMQVEMREVGGITIPVQRKEDLIAYKKILGREVDRYDLEQIGYPSPS